MEAAEPLGTLIHEFAPSTQNWVALPVGNLLNDWLYMVLMGIHSTSLIPYG